MDDDAVQILAGVQEFGDPCGALFIHVADLLPRAARRDRDSVGVVFVVGFTNSLDPLAVPELEGLVWVLIKVHANNAESENLKVPQGKDFVIDQLPVG